MAHLTTTIPVPADLTELLADPSLTLQELARACHMAPEVAPAHATKTRSGLAARTCCEKGVNSVTSSATST